MCTHLPLPRPAHPLTVPLSRPKAVAALNTSPLLDVAGLRAGELQCDYSIGPDAVSVRWSAPLTPASTGISAALPAAALSGVSTYTLAADGRLCRHELSNLRLNGRRLPSSTLAEWLRLYRRSSPASPAEAFATAAELLAAVGAEAPPPAEGGGEGGEGAEASGAEEPFPPLPGSEEWAAYEARDGAEMEPRWSRASSPRCRQGTPRGSLRVVEQPRPPPVSPPTPASPPVSPHHRPAAERASCAAVLWL